MEKLTDQTTRLKLNNDTTIPCLGFGTYKIKDPGAAYTAVQQAIEAGYRHIDTAAYYDNEEEVGRAIRDAIASKLVTREELFVTSKVWKDQCGYDRCMAAFEESYKRLGLSYLDLYLVHWPASPTWDPDWENTNRSTWKAMMEINRSGRVKAIGVSNFLPHHLKALMDQPIRPAVDQIEINPGFLQKETVDFCQANGILVEAWSPLGRGKSLKHPLLEQIAKEHERTVAQIILRWELQHDILPLPKSVTPSRIRENMALFDFSLSAEEMAAIDAIEPYGNSGHSPD